MSAGPLNRLIRGASPPQWSLAHRRAHSVGVGSAIAAASVHAVLVGVFAVVGVWPLVWFNIGSVGVWVASAALLLRGSILAGMLLGYVELVVHALYATFILGWSAQFHLAMPMTAGLYLVLGPLNRTMRWLAPLVSMIVWVAAFALWWEKPPEFQLSPGLVTGFAFAGGIEVFVVAGLLIFVLARAAERAEAHLALEHERSERLVHNMLPQAIATRLKSGEAQIADRVEEASILFADLVGFTLLSASTKPDELVLALDGVFTRFDALVEKHQLEKIKTIGDAYMVAAGVPRPRADHAQALANLALDLLEVLEGLAPVHGTKLNMRIGINSGVVVAGVIGKTKPAYDLWGDTVNTAARMESHGEPGRIHVSRAARERIGAAYRFESRGVVDVKGKGPMETFFLLGRAA